MKHFLSHTVVQNLVLFCPQFSKLARDMKVPIGLGGGSGSKSPMGTNSSSGPAEDNEDEFPDGLC